MRVPFRFETLRSSGVTRPQGSLRTVRPFRRTRGGFARFVDGAHRLARAVYFWIGCPHISPTDAHGLSHFDGTALYGACDPTSRAFHPDWKHPRSTICGRPRKGSSFWSTMQCFLGRGPLPYRRPAVDAAHRCSTSLLPQEGENGPQRRMVGGKISSCPDSSRKLNKQFVRPPSGHRHYPPRNRTSWPRSPLRFTRAGLALASSGTWLMH